MRVVGRGVDDPNWRAWKLENLRRSLAMLRPGQTAGLGRDEAIELVEQLQRAHRRLERIRSVLAGLLADEGDP